MRRNLLIRPSIHPGFGDVATAILLKAVDKLAQAVAEQTAGSGPAHRAAQIAQDATQTALLVRLPGNLLIARAMSAKHFRKLVPVLVSGHGDQRQESHHGWETSGHIFLLRMPM
jgi:hypothetical protein